MTECILYQRSGRVDKGARTTRYLGVEKASKEYISSLNADYMLGAIT